MLVFATASSGCGSYPELFAGSDTGATGGGGAGGGAGGNDIDVVGGSSGDGGGGTGGVADPCSALNCAPDQHCEITGTDDEATAECVGNDCATLVCGEEQLCTETSDGAICKDKCTGDVDCPEEQYCDLYQTAARASSSSSAEAQHPATSANVRSPPEPSPSVPAATIGIARHIRSAKPASVKAPARSPRVGSRRSRWKMCCP